MFSTIIPAVLLLLPALVPTTLAVETAPPSLQTFPQGALPSRIHIDGKHDYEAAAQESIKLMRRHTQSPDIAAFAEELEIDIIATEEEPNMLLKHVSRLDSRATGQDHAVLALFDNYYGEAGSNQGGNDQVGYFLFFSRVLESWINVMPAILSIMEVSALGLLVSE